MYAGCPTTFPNGPSLGASFDRKLWTAIGRTIGTEARGLANQGKCTLYFLDPNINLLRDPVSSVQYPPLSRSCRFLNRRTPAVALGALARGPWRRSVFER